MIYVLNIGQYNSNGKFETSVWNELFCWLSEKSQYINLYSYNDEQVKKILETCTYRFLPSIDKSETLNGYQLINLTKNTKKLIRNFSYNINNGIQYLFFGGKDKILAEMQIEDWNNFVFLYLNQNEKKDILNYVYSTDKNKKICEMFHDDITDMVDDDWEPLV